MKKVIYLISILFAVALMSASCEKEDPIVPEPEDITVEMLEGDWKFVSLNWEFVGNPNFTDISTICDVDLNENYAYTTLNFYDMTTTEVMLYTDCMKDGAAPDDRVYPYILSNNIINCNNGSRIFEIINVETFDGTELVLKFKSAKVISGFPINGIYTLQKQ